MTPDLFPSFTNRNDRPINPNNNQVVSNTFGAPLTWVWVGSTVPWNFPDFSGNGQFPAYTDILGEYKKSLIKQGNTTGANSINNLINNYWTDIYPANALSKIYESYYRDVFQPSNNEYQNILTSVDKDYKSKLWAQFDEAKSNFWPDGVLRKQIEDIYNQQAVAQANKFGWQQNLARALAARHGIDPSQVQVWVNQLWSQQNDEILKIRWAQLSALENLAKTYQDYYSQFVDKYGASNDKYVVDTAQRLKQLRDSISQAALTSQAQIGELLFQQWLARRWQGWWGGGWSIQDIINWLLGQGWYTPPNVKRNVNTWVFNMQWWLL